MAGVVEAAVALDVVNEGYAVIVVDNTEVFVGVKLPVKVSWLILDKPEMPLVSNTKLSIDSNVPSCKAELVRMAVSVV